MPLHTFVTVASIWFVLSQVTALMLANAEDSLDMHATTPPALICAYRVLLFPLSIDSVWNTVVALARGWQGPLATVAMFANSLLWAYIVTFCSTLLVRRKRSARD